MIYHLTEFGYIKTIKMKYKLTEYGYRKIRKSIIDWDDESKCHFNWYDSKNKP